MEDPEVVGVFAVGKERADPESSFFDRTRQIGEYNGYTCNHLPVKNGKPCVPKAAVANPAIFAARIAFSSFIIRAWLK